MNETHAVQNLLSEYTPDAHLRARAQDRARHWLSGDHGRKSDIVAELLQGFDLGTAEGRSLMELAEAYLRIEDTATRDALLRDKLGAAGWQKTDTGAASVKWARGAMRLGNTLIHTPLAGLAKPVMAMATGQGMKQLAGHFVVGETIEKALANAQKQAREREWYSYDVLGEGARTAEAAENYFRSYLHAINAVGDAAGGISVKLSALHPKYEETHRALCFDEMVARLGALCEAAAARNIPIMVDAEEERRLDLSLSIIEAVRALPQLAGWNRMGTAVQAYLKRTPQTISYLQDMAIRLGCTFNVRLVKGAYWDSEIKYAQSLGHEDFPVFTQKTYTDLSYIVCAQRLLDASHLHPSFGSHNALSLATIAELADGRTDLFETQRLYGMGDQVHEAMREEGYTIGVYAPVGPHHDLLPYLVRRLLENGANTSFLKSASGDLDRALSDPFDRLQGKEPQPHPSIRHPLALYGDRENSLGVKLGQKSSLTGILADIRGTNIDIDIENTKIDEINAIIGRARHGYKNWQKTPVEARSATLERLADRMEMDRAPLLALLQDEGRKTLADAIAELREAIDFCRYYAAEARRTLTPSLLPGPDGERNTYTHEGRGVFVCISPWNFPLAIFLGQVAAALAAGNAVIAKPAEQTPRIGAYAVRLAHESGIPADVLQCVQGDGSIGAALTGHEQIDGVAFTGSYEVGKIIQRTLAAKDGPIVPLIAETAGLNAMAVDGSALAEQVVDDILLSAFGSAGQRCSALRVLLLDDSAAAKILPLLAGAMAELRLGDPHDPATDVGPLIDKEAADTVRKAIVELKAKGRVLYECPATEDGLFVGPLAIDMTGHDLPRAEIFGPVLQIHRVPDLSAAIRDLNGRGYALTFGLHTRLPSREAEFIELADAGNVYINRSIIGAVVGVQPFGGHGKSGTGPKAGGPATLYAYSREKHISVNTAAAGGNASLVALQDSL